MKEESESLKRAFSIVTEVSICRVRNIAKSMSAMISAISGTITALITSFFPYLFITDPLIGTMNLLLLLTLLEYIIFVAVKKSFTYTFDMAQTAGENIRDIHLTILPISILIPLSVAKMISIPQLALASPFIAIAMLKMLIAKEQPRKVGGASLLALSMISSAAPLPTAPTSLAISLSMSCIIESLMYVEEAEKCGKRKD